MDKKPKIVTITGTKGKTTTTNLIADMTHRLGNDTLHVNTIGHYVNGQQKSTVDDSKRVWGIKTPSLIPGRYLGEFLDGSLQNDPVAVLEGSFSCYKGGLGYRRHNVGVFLNVFEDHIDSCSEVRNQSDLARAKSFIFSKIERDGWAVFNADDEFVCSVLDAIPEDSGVQLLPCGRDFKYFNVTKHLDGGGVAMRLADQSVVFQSREDKFDLYDFKPGDITYGGTFEPSMWNILHSCGALYGLYGDVVLGRLNNLLEQYQPSGVDGRLVRLEGKNGVTVIADYAHEKESLHAVAKLARSLVRDGGRLIGVVRLNHERPDDVIHSFGQFAGKLFDELVVYDKIDGYWREAQEFGMKRFPQVVGRTSILVTQGAKIENDLVQRIVREDEAVEYSASHAKSGDVVVVIVNDNVERSLGFIKKSFGAEVVA